MPDTMQGLKNGLESQTELSDVRRVVLPPGANPGDLGTLRDCGV